MLETSENILPEAISEALETMAFMTVMPIEEEMPYPCQSIEATMSFSGPISGEVKILAGIEFAHMIAANVLGVDFGDPEAQSKSTDAFKEMLNTVCGVLLPKLARSSADVFDVTLPQAQKISGQEKWEEFVATSGATVLNIDENLVAVRLSIT